MADTTKTRTPRAPKSVEDYLASAQRALAHAVKASPDGEAKSNIHRIEIAVRKVGLDIEEAKLA